MSIYTYTIQFHIQDNKWTCSNYNKLTKFYGQSVYLKQYSSFTAFNVRRFTVRRGACLFMTVSKSLSKNLLFDSSQ